MSRYDSHPGAPGDTQSKRQDNQHTKMKVDQVLLTLCVISTLTHLASAALPLLAYAAPALFGFGMLGGFGDKFGGLFGQKRKEPTYSPMFGGSFGGINAQDMSMMFMSGFPPNGGMQGGMMGGMGGGMPGNRQSMGGLGRGGGMPGMGGSLGQQSLGLGGSGFGKRRRRRSIRPLV
uniref:Uncharacterized protein n=2 Tax=Magallana gigas TaxID=29159 RepID=A0A8W8IFC0_MAGGI